MCGIAGIIGKPTPEEIIAILQQLEIRGDDATGVGLNYPNMYPVLKAGIDAKKYCKLSSIRDNLAKYTAASTVALLHTRQATNGTSANNHNNHPIWNKRGIIIHNGIVSTDTTYETIGETDTEQMLECITQNGLTKGIPKLSGSFAIAYQDFRNRHIVYLYKHISPLCLGMKNGNIYFCSTPDILKRAIGDYQPIKLKEHRLYKIDAEKLTIQKLCKIKPKFSYPFISYLYQYPEWERFFEEEIYYD